MKKSKFLLLFVLTALFVGFSACGDSDDDVIVKLEKSTAEIERDSTVTIKITEGNGGYTATTADDKIATATIGDNTVAIKAVGVGPTTITVKDKEGKTATIAVSVFSIAGEWEVGEAKIEVEGVSEEDAATIETDFESYALKSLTLKEDGTYEMTEKNGDDSDVVTTGTYTYAGNTLTLTEDVEEGEEADVYVLNITELTKTSLKFTHDGTEILKEEYPDLTEGISSYNLTR